VKTAADNVEHYLDYVTGRGRNTMWVTRKTVKTFQAVVLAKLAAEAELHLVTKKAVLNALKEESEYWPIDETFITKSKLPDMTKDALMEIISEHVYALGHVSEKLDYKFQLALAEHFSRLFPSVFPNTKAILLGIEEEMIKTREQAQNNVTEALSKLLTTLDFRDVNGAQIMWIAHDTPEFFRHLYEAAVKYYAEKFQVSAIQINDKVVEMGEIWPIRTRMICNRDKLPKKSGKDIVKLCINFVKNIYPSDDSELEGRCAQLKQQLFEAAVNHFFNLFPTLHGSAADLMETVEFELDEQNLYSDSSDCEVGAMQLHHKYGHDKISLYQSRQRPLMCVTCKKSKRSKRKVTKDATKKPTEITKAGVDQDEISLKNEEMTVAQQMTPRRTKNEKRSDYHSPKRRRQLQFEHRETSSSSTSDDEDQQTRSFTHRTVKRKRAESSATPGRNFVADFSKMTLQNKD